MRLGSTLFLITLLTLTFTNLAFPNISTSFSSLSNAAYAQTPRSFGANQLPNSTDLGLPSDNSTSSGAPSDNATDLSALSPDNSTDLGAALGNNSTSLTNTPQTASPTSSATTPEFGPISLAVLVISIMSIIIISSRTRLRFS
ncbi:PEFG-CTERM sorting domain-containing protein [Candidatus Nitrosotalea bavarica]|uniref:PEFG-CTERM sorting domain-containing protein n=1 Tax=Candidatus Nitrosotalea bavarica TaxID=1903277 RepID=UPI000C7157B7|nr:PEFG-CTERM sorting domain-containing protein [Candidatus Nitrosotalea bavarica]